MLSSIKAVCFCRSYESDTPACNQNPKLLLNAMNLIMSEDALFTPRKLVPHLLDTEESLWCYSGPFYATISIDYKTHKLLRHTKCVSKQIELLKSDKSYRAKTFDNSIFCDTLPLFVQMSQCFQLNWHSDESRKLMENNVICCCDYDLECQLLSVDIRRLTFNFAKFIF
ncbi:Transcription antitermination protein NusB [Dirofilaria immitis]